MKYCRNCGKPQDDRKMMGYCECGGKLISERQYKLELKDKCSHVIGWAKTYVTSGVLVNEQDAEIRKNSICFRFKYCPLCGNKTRFYTKER